MEVPFDVVPWKYIVPLPPFDAVIVALNTLRSIYKTSKIHLVAGGADKFLEISKLIKANDFHQKLRIFVELFEYHGY